MQSSAEAERARLAAVLRFARCLLSSSSCLSLWEEEEDESAGGEGEEGAGDFESPSLRLQLQHRKEQLAKALRTFCDVISSWFVGSVKVFAEDEAEEDKNQDRKRDDGPSLLAAILVPAAAGVGSDGDQLGAVPPMVPLRCSDFDTPNRCRCHPAPLPPGYGFRSLKWWRGATFKRWRSLRRLAMPRHCPRAAPTACCSCCRRPFLSGTCEGATKTTKSFKTCRGSFFSAA